MSLQKLHDAIKAKGVENLDDLPGKIKKLLNKYDKLYNDKSVKAIDYKTGKRRPAIVEELQETAEYILEEVDVFLLEEEEKKTPPADPPTDPPTPPVTDDKDKNPKPKSWFDNLFGV